MIFHYEFIDKSGKKGRGTIDAPSIAGAKEHLRRQGVMVLSLGKSAKTLFHRKTKLSFPFEEKLSFTIQLANLLKASLPLYESLILLAEEHEKEKYHPLLQKLTEEIKRGAPLSDALSQFPESFDMLYCAIIASGEATGNLSSALDKLSSLLLQEKKWKQKLKAALLYPLLLLSFSLLLIGVMLFYVLPSVEELLAERDVNRFTSCVMGVSHFFREKGLIFFPLLFASLSSGLFLLKKSALYPILKCKLLFLPLVKEIAWGGALSRFTRTLALLLQGGVGMMPALQLARKTMRHPPLEGVIIESEKRILEGSLLSKELKKSPLIPPLVARMAAIGEEGGELPAMLLKVADQYEEEVDKKVSRLLTLAQPLFLLVVGAIVGLIMMAVLLPLTDFNAFLGE